MKGVSGILQIADTWIIAVYGVMALSIFAKFRDEIAQSNLVLFGIALVCLGTSIVIDAFDPKDIFVTNYHVVEDGPKLLGIAAWLGYYTHLCLQRLQEALVPAPVRRVPDEPSVGAWQ